MLRGASLDEARGQWRKQATHDADEYARRQENDFLLARNHDAERIDFHTLRHTCGVWLAVTGAHPKVVQTIIAGVLHRRCGPQVPDFHVAGLAASASARVFVACFCR